MVKTLVVMGGCHWYKSTFCCGNNSLKEPPHIVPSCFFTTDIRCKRKQGKFEVKMSNLCIDPLTATVVYTE